MTEFNKFDFAFLGGVFPDHLVEQIQEKSKGNIQYAANKLQWNLIKGIEENTGTTIKLFNLTFIGSFPQRYKQPWIRTSYFSHKGNSQDINIGFINITIIKQFLLHRRPLKYLDDWCKTNSRKDKVLIAYSANFINELDYVKNNYPNIKLCIILPDLPIYMNISSSKFSLLRLHNTRLQEKLFKTILNIDYSVLLTETMAEYLKIEKDKYVVIEGISEESRYTNSNQEASINFLKKRIVYTGTLTKKYGVMNLVNSFRLIENDQYELIICGAGEAANEVIDASNSDNRIKYLGLQQPTRIQEIQLNATLLINPRENNEEFTKYSFPSKIMEYMASGRPVLCYKLDGIPSEYDEYLIYFKDNDEQKVADTIVHYAELQEQELSKIGERAKKFVLKNKNPKSQTKKMLQMITKI